MRREHSECHEMNGGVVSTSAAQSATIDFDVNNVGLPKKTIARRRLSPPPPPRQRGFKRRKRREGGEQGRGREGGGGGLMITDSDLDRDLNCLTCSIIHRQTTLAPDSIGSLCLRNMCFTPNATASPPPLSQPPRVLFLSPFFHSAL